MPIPHWLQEHCSRLLARDEQLTNLNLNIRRLDSDMMAALAQAMLGENSLLVVLNLTSSFMNSPEALAPLAETVLPVHKSLQKLHLSYNRLENVSAIGQALTTNQCLTELYLNYNKIDTDSAYSIARGLHHNKTLKVLQLNYNEIGDKGCCAIATALKDNQSLLVLGLARNGISATGATALLRALDTNLTLIQLDLQENNDMPVEQAARIQIMCRANQAGRQFLGVESLQMGLWPALLERLKEDPDLLYFFLDAKPDLCRPHV